MKSIFSHNTKLPRDARKELRPREEFIDRGRERFLAAFDASEMGARNAVGALPARVPYVTLFFKFAIGAAAAFFVFAGFSAYADTTNVPATNPLYPLKRLSESVRLALAPVPDKPKVQAALAVRRAAEIDELDASAPSSTLIASLTNDLDEDIKGSLSAGGPRGNDGRQGHGHSNGVRNSAGAGVSGGLPAITVTATTTVATSGSASVLRGGDDANDDDTSGDNGGDGARRAIGVYCNALTDATSGVLLGHLRRFDLRCGANGTAGDGPDASSGAGVSGGLPAITVTATTTINATDANGQFPGPRGVRGGDDDGEDGGGTGIEGHLRGSLGL